MARKLQPHEQDVYALVSTINELVDGRSNNTGNVENNSALTLTPGATTTAKLFPTCSHTSVILLVPRTANAAAAQPTTYISSTLNGSFIVTHLNNAQTDRTFDFSCVGG
jgi:hypothetical protein